MSENYTHINDELLVKFLLGESSNEESGLVEQWLSADEANRKYFESFKSVWQQSRVFATNSEVDENLAWQKFRARIKKENTTGVLHPVGKSLGWMKVAAVLVLTIGIAAIAWVLVNKESNPVEMAFVAGDSVLTRNLPDGSVVTLNKKSSLTYPEKFKGNKRQVELVGEAFFDVAPDKKKPFEIQVGDVMVKVVGTSFNVRNTNGETEVIVEAGIVEVTRHGQTVRLLPGQKVAFDQQDVTMKIQKEEDQLYKHYLNREFVCDDTPLWKLVEVLNEAYQTNIIIERPDLRNLRMNVTFSNESLDVILEIIKETYNTHHIRIVRTEDKIILR